MLLATFKTESEWVLPGSMENFWVKGCRIGANWVDLGIAGLIQAMAGMAVTITSQN